MDSENDELRDCKVQESRHRHVKQKQGLNINLMFNLPLIGDIEKNASSVCEDTTIIAFCLKMSASRTI